MDKRSDRLTDGTINSVSVNALRSTYAMMARIRKFEEKVAELLEDDEIKCPTHLYIGQEAIAAGVCVNLQKGDYIFSTHRSHGHYIAKGGSLKLMMAELYGKKTGCSRGKGGSMHIVAEEVGFLGSSSVVGGNIPLAVGAALASNIRQNTHVSVAFFGDGATDEGIFHECLNFASLHKLPVIFVCENNFFSTHLPLSLRQPGDNIYHKAEMYMMPGIRVDGNNVIEVIQASEKAIEGARNGKGPALIECRTFRWRAHVGPWLDVDVGFRRKEEVEKWMKRCPIKACEKVLIERGDLSEREISHIYKEIDEEIEEALVFAKESPFPDESELIEDVFKI